MLHNEMIKDAPSPKTASISSSGTPFVSGYTTAKLIKYGEKGNKDPQKYTVKQIGKHISTIH